MKNLDFNKFWDHETKEHIDVASQTFAALQNELETLTSMAAETITNGEKILFFGNGGSASDAQHLATEFTIRYVSNRSPIAAIALTTDTSAITAAGNDLGFDQIFARQIEAIGKPGDLAIGISTSGTSANVIKALETARAMNIKTAGFTGQTGGDMNALCDVTLKVPSTTTARIQEMHITLGQIFCGALEKQLGLV